MKFLGTHGFRGFALVAAVAIMVACGGGGDGGGGTGPAPVTSASISLFAGSLQRAGSNDGPAAAAQFNLPAGVAQDASGTIYVADSGNHTIRKITADGTVSTLAGAAGQPGSADGTGGAARFSSPRAVVVDGQGNLYVADTGNAVVRKIAAGGVVTTLAGAAGQTGGADGSGANARFVSPVALALDPAGNLFVADEEGAVRKIAPGGIVSTFAGATGQHGFLVGNGTAARFMAVSGVAVDAGGHVAVSEYSKDPGGGLGVFDGRVRRFDSQAQALPWGSAVDGLVKVTPPSSIAADAAGNILVASKGFFALGPGMTFLYDSVKRITAQGEVVLIAGQDDTIGALLDGPGATARFYWPEGIAVGTAGRLVVADTQNHAIRQIDSQGTVSTVAGGAGGGLVDGPRETARFNDPRGIAVHPDGTLDIGDARNGVVRRISPAGTVSTLSFTRNGTVINRFAFPEYIALDESGVLYIREESSWNVWPLYAAQPSGQLRLLDTQTYSGLSAGLGRLYMAAGSLVSFIDTGGAGDALSTPHHPVSGFSDVNAALVAATLIAPNGVLYVAAFDNTVSAVDAEGHVTRLAGQPGVAGHADGDSSRATLERPAALALDTAGNLYVADISTIRKITPDGEVRTVAGTPGQDLATPGPLPGSIGHVKGLVWYGGMLYATVQNAVLRIGPLD